MSLALIILTAIAVITISAQDFWVRFKASFDTVYNSPVKSDRNPLSPTLFDIKLFQTLLQIKNSTEDEIWIRHYIKQLNESSKLLPLQNTQFCEAITMEELSQEPFSNKQELLQLFVTDSCITNISSIFKQFFEENGAFYHSSQKSFEKWSEDSVLRDDGGKGFYTLMEPMKTLPYALPPTIVALLMAGVSEQFLLQELDNLLDGRLYEILQSLQLFIYKVKIINGPKCAETAEALEKQNLEGSEIKGLRYAYYSESDSLVCLVFCVLSQVPTGPLTLEEKRRILDLHNEHRRTTAKGETPNEPGATDMNELYWDDGLAVLATNAAGKCKYDHNPEAGAELYQIYQNQGLSFDIADPNEGVGENIYINTQVAPVTIDDMLNGGVTAWYNEHNYFTYSPKSCQTGKVCGHYEAIVSSNIRYVGCGYTFCDTIESSLNYWNGKKGILFFCNYYGFTQGSVFGKAPYQSIQGDTSKICSNCDKDRGCIDGLCSGCMNPLFFDIEKQYIEKCTDKTTSEHCEELTSGGNKYACSYYMSYGYCSKYCGAECPITDNMWLFTAETCTDGLGRTKNNLKYSSDNVIGIPEPKEDKTGNVSSRPNTIVITVLAVFAAVFLACLIGIFAYGRHFMKNYRTYNPVQVQNQL